MQELLSSLQKNKKAILVLSVLILYVSLFFVTYIILHTADLGRFIINGREILAGNWQAVLTTNYYSYTYSGYPFINHHWFFGVIAYVIHQAFGFVGLSLFGVLAATTAFGVMVYWSYRRFGLFAAVASSLLVLPLISFRQEIRPELISMLGVVFYFYVLEKFVHTRLSALWLWVPIVAMQLIWQNTHLFFVLGLFELFVFWVYAIATKQKRAILHLGFLGVCSALLTLANPNGLTGALMPFTIFTEYGYRVAENQTILFMYNYFNAPLQVYEIVLAVLSVIATGFVFWKVTKKQRAFTLLLIILFFSFGAVAFKVNRLASFWGLMGIPFAAAVVSHIQVLYGKKYTTWLSNSLGLMFISSVGFILFLVAASTGLFMPISANTGFGLAPGSNGAAEFIKKQNIPGPIFNNYDIGGYLIYHFYPEEQVFVDNRPEAYPVSFFEDEYIASQNSTEKWSALAEKEKINLIVFYRHDLTEWAQKFMIDRIADENWVPVYVDAYSLIFVKNIPKNADVIQLFEIPAERFSIGGL